MKNVSLVFGLLFFLPWISFAQTTHRTESLKVGDRAPEFALAFATRDTMVFAPAVKLSELVGQKNIVLAFYPADWSGGCTKEVCTFRDKFADLQNLNVEVLAVSGDYVFSHYEWAKYHNLPFKLLSDHSHEVAKEYESYNELSGYNKRTVFVVDKSGKIAYMNLQYDVRTPVDFQKLQEVLANLK